MNDTFIYYRTKDGRLHAYGVFLSATLFGTKRWHFSSCTYDERWNEWGSTLPEPMKSERAAKMKVARLLKEVPTYGTICTLPESVPQPKVFENAN